MSRTVLLPSASSEKVIDVTENRTRPTWGSSRKFQIQPRVLLFFCECGDNVSQCIGVTDTWCIYLFTFQSQPAFGVTLVCSRAG